MMSTPTEPATLSEKAPALPVESEERPEDPVAPPRVGPWRMLRDVLDHGGPGYLQFAITNVCNAKCDFCGFAVDKFDPAHRRSVTLPEAKEAIDICVRNHLGYLLFVGGEPLVHRDLPAMVRYAAERGIHPMICTNGSLWTDTNMRHLARQGLASVIMSVDAHDAARHEENRGLPDVCRKMKHANEVFRTLGVPTTASVTASRLVEDYDRLPEFLLAMGFDKCTFSYPLDTLHSGYLSFSDSNLVTYRPEELIEVYERIKRMKARRKLPVMNPKASLNDMQRHLRGEPEQFGCLGGHKYFYLDWNLNLYRCHYWEEPMCHIRDFDRTRLIRDGCTRCMIDCYRDPSVLQFIAVNASDTWHDVRRGRWRSAWRRLRDARNVVSLRAVWESRDWVRRV